ncbi:MAG: M1 family peptidase [Cytophagales bacterium]|nr:MAG: M1 family peptidase [Cytophagales bacterium]
MAQNNNTDVHSFAQPQKAYITHLNLNLEADFDNKILKGKATLEYKNIAQTSQIHLDTRDLDILQITQNNQPIKFQLTEPKEYLGQALIIDINPQLNQGTLTIEYQTHPQAAALQWLTPEQTAGKKNPFLFTQSQAILARTWVPCQDSPGIRFTYTATIKTPKNLMAVMSAQNPQIKNSEGIYQFEMKQPIPAYLLALAIGDFEFAPLGERTGVYAENNTLEKAKYEFAELENMLQLAEKLYGKYEWERYDLIVLPPSFPFGGMENPRITFATPTIIAEDRSLISLVAHELAHSWSGNLVTNATWNDFWINEGFTVYFERRIMEAMMGKSYAEMLAYLGYQDLLHTLELFGKDNPDTRLKLDLKDRDPDEGVSEIAYEKGYFFLITLEKKVGRPKFDAFLHQYFQKNAFQGMDTEKFLEYLKKELPETQTIDLNAWIYQPGLPSNFALTLPERFIEVEKQLKKWKNGTPPEKLNTQQWTTHEWLHFIEQLPAEISTDELEKLDQQFKFSQSGNAEIITQWLQITLPLSYTPAFAPAENFLMNVGRRKFLVPIYKAMLKTEQGTQKAKEIYQKARKNYHSVATNTLDKLILEQQR